ncbi:Protein of unknown function [Pyronema omphalodes CBS 100304]|uniref:Uncharacterized protein n=1 Tax=Pyronema omphalodes (strain CBS 100304) TaxID=1076935 RepID=U4LJ88_PYROM|nr:Protein of unknown function [Pyronema omphalodes CBS 100304]
MEYCISLHLFVGKIVHLTLGIRAYVIGTCRFPDSCSWSPPAAVPASPPSNTA